MEATAGEVWARPDEFALAQRLPVGSDDYHAEPAGWTRASVPSAVQAMHASAPVGQVVGGMGGHRPIVMQRADTDATPTAAAPAASMADEGPGAASTDPSPVSAMGEREMEELLRKLYPKLRSLFTRELLVARERAGSLADAR